MSTLAEQIPDLVRGHIRQMEDRAIFWREYRAAYESKFWKRSNRWTRSGALPGTAVGGGVADPLPIKVEVNLIRPAVKNFLAGLFYKRPSVIAKAPAVWSGAPGRPRRPEKMANELVQTYIGDWLERKDFQHTSRFAYLMALMYGSSAYKVGYTTDEQLPERKPGKGKIKARDPDITDRLWVEALPPWQVIWDERANSLNAMRYIGHLRQEPEDALRDMFGDDVIENLTAEHIADFLDEGMSGRNSTTDRRDESYFWLLEFYDYTTRKVHFLLGLGVASTVSSWKEITVNDWPYARPTIVPVVLEQRPEHPLVGLPVIDSLYQKNSEKNLLMSIIANAMRHDAARKRLVREGTLHPSELEKLNNPYDSEWIVISEGNKPFEQIFGNLTNPEIGRSLEQYERLLNFSQQEERGTADVTQGRTKQGTPLSAAEVSLLSQYSESSSGLVAQGMDDAVASVTELILMVTADEVGSLSVLHDGEVHNLKAEQIGLPWRLSVTDSGVTPTQRNEARALWVQIQPQILELVNLAAGGPPVEEGAPASVSPEVMIFARKALDYLIELLQLPRGMQWGQIVAEAQNLFGDEEEDQGVPPEEIDSLVNEALAGMSNIPQLPPEAGGNAPQEVAP